MTEQSWGNPPGIFDTNTMFYVSCYSGRVFHRLSGCGNSVRWDDSEIISISLADCKKRGLRPCKVCMSDAYEEPWEFDPTAPQIEDVAERLGKEVPPEEWDKVPPNVTEPERAYALLKRFAEEVFSKNAGLCEEAFHVLPEDLIHDLATYLHGNLKEQKEWKDYYLKPKGADDGEKDDSGVGKGA